ncbi:MAG TPA: AAA family ATPase, partial [Jatrophihabitantaceae bacterium]|nr:AAA family ATPase [Jatrophihabitantaceae bacterium]
MAVRRRAAGGLPAELTSFVGRRHELALARGLLGQARCLTLTGPGGVGKTRLALRLAATLRPGYSDGVHLVDLTDLTDLDVPELLADTVAAALGLVDDPNTQPWGRLETFLAGRQVLLVLDNCEHVRQACAAFVERLSSVPGRVRVLATSRQPLGVAAERTLVVAPLALPEQQGVVRPETLDQYEAIALFLDRARAIVPGLRVTEDNCDQVVRLCRQLDGLPLAIELACSRLRAYSVQQLVELTGDPFAVLTTGNRSGPARQQTLRALFDWSHDLCTERARVLWSRLSVFAGGFEPAAVEAVCAGDGLVAADIAATLTELVDKSIVIGTERDSHVRYRMLETVQRYGHDRLVEAGRWIELGRRHRDWVQRLVADADERWVGPDQVGWYRRMRVERANLQAALTF